MMPRWLWALLASLLIALWWAGRPVASIPAGLQKAGTTSPACPSAPTSPDAAEPLQSAIAGVPSPFRVGVATVSPLAGFSVQARVLSREN